MLNSLKQAGRNMGHEIRLAWKNMSEGWCEWLSRSSESLADFSRRKEEDRGEVSALSTFPRWSLLAGEVEETPTDIVVRIDVPGMNKEDCSITLQGNVLHLSGEKHFECETHDSACHVRERAYGAFQRDIALPRKVNIDKAVARCKNGVLTVRLPKAGSGDAKAIAVS
ncbi:MAG: Hsp20/alpha crystallin family protein [Polaromonas sp.]|nr:Hsp20/alpha crystallin family protein [Polaromonas sp.]